MDIFAKSRELDKQLSEIISYLKSGGGTEDTHIEYKACALAAQKKKDDLVKTVSAFLNSSEGGCFLLGIEEDEQKQPIFSGLERTEIVLDNKSQPTNVKRFHNRDDYEQALRMYIEAHLDDGALRNDDCLRLKWAKDLDVSICAIFVTPFIPKDGQIPTFARIYETDDNFKKRKSKEVFYQRQGNYTIALENVKLARLTASRREGALISPGAVSGDTPSGKVSTVSEIYLLDSINEQGVNSKGNPCLEINLVKDGVITTKRRLTSFSKHSEITEKARSLIGHKVRTSTWGRNEQEAKSFERQDYFINLYPVFESNSFK